MIDAGGPVEPLLDVPRRARPFELTHILLTHHHHDHVSELDEVLERHPGTPVLIHELERDLVPAATGTMEPGELDPQRRARDRAAAHARPHRRDAVAARQRHRRVHRRHAVQGLGRRRARARPHDLRGPASPRSWTSCCSCRRHADPSRPHRPDDGRRRAGAQRVRADLARPRPRGHRAVHGARRAGDADPARRRLRRRPQGVGPLARRLGRHRPGLAGEPSPSAARRRRLLPPASMRSSSGERQDPHLTRGAHREDRGACRRSGDPSGGHPRSERGAHQGAGATRRSNAATSRRPSRSSPRSGR